MNSGVLLVSRINHAPNFIVTAPRRVGMTEYASSASRTEGDDSQHTAQKSEDATVSATVIGSTESIASITTAARKPLQMQAASGAKQTPTGSKYRFEPRT